MLLDEFQFSPWHFQKSLRNVYLFQKSPLDPHDCTSILWPLSLIDFTPKLKQVTSFIPQNTSKKVIDFNENNSNFLNIHILQDTLLNAVQTFLTKLSWTTLQAGTIIIFL